MFFSMSSGVLLARNCTISSLEETRSALRLSACMQTDMRSAGLGATACALVAAPRLLRHDLHDLALYVLGDLLLRVTPVGRRCGVTRSSSAPPSVHAFSRQNICAGQTSSRASRTGQSYPSEGRSRGQTTWWRQCNAGFVSELHQRRNAQHAPGPGMPARLSGKKSQPW